MTAAAAQTDKKPMSKSKAEILDAAAEVFTKLGADTASIDDVARHLGSTKGRIYHHFPSKGVLLAEVCLRAADFVHEEVGPAVDPAETPEANLRKMITLHIPEILRTLPYHKVIIQSYVGMNQKSTTSLERELFKQIRTERRAYEDIFRGILQAGMQDGSFRDQNLSIALQSILLLINAPVFWYRPREDEPASFIPDLANQLSDMAVAALR
ncbi:TetR/AcrR family transcriptional regulator [Shimia haliotis]|uniref:Transcriptional regulator, TetR family n=1 Tax=Shimia haliotis TaxID=1280847 RepID=A0A1I4E5M4_9RHOB|nr:TetR/AcrR family transcriptional regulator [Shimia haliotis]SFL01055.1 transcriptional regulator, TetR family [Shimia haliotis]